MNGCIHKVRLTARRPEKCKVRLTARQPEKCRIGLSVSHYKDRILVPDQYSGATTITPSTAQQTLQTRDKMVRDDIVIEPVGLGVLDASTNGTYTPVDVMGFSEVNVNVQPVLERLTATANGTYRPGEGADGFSEVVIEDPAEWMTDGIMDASEPSGNLVISSAVNIPQYGMTRRNGITSLTFTSAAPVILGEHAFDTSKNIKSVFINRLGTMGYYAFAYCTELLSVTIKNATDAIFLNYMCRNTKCNTVKINGTPAQMNEAVFKNNGNYRHVFVSWSQGEVANEPWGATNKVTIYFDTVFDENMNVVSYSQAVNAGTLGS